MSKICEVCGKVTEDAVLSIEERLEEGFRTILTVANDRYVNIILVTNDRDYYKVIAEIDKSLFFGVIVERAVIEVEFILEPDNTIFITSIKPKIAVIDRYAMQKKTYEALYVPTGLAYIIALKGLLAKYLRQ